MSTHTSIPCYTANTSWARAVGTMSVSYWTTIDTPYCCPMSWAMRWEEVEVVLLIEPVLDGCTNRRNREVTPFPLPNATTLHSMHTRVSVLQCSAEHAEPWKLNIFKLSFEYVTGVLTTGQLCVYTCASDRGLRWVGPYRHTPAWQSWVRGRYHVETSIAGPHHWLWIVCTNRHR